MLTSVHQRPPPSANCANIIGVTTGEQWRTGVNETTFEPSRTFGVPANGNCGVLIHASHAVL